MWKILRFVARWLVDNALSQLVFGSSIGAKVIAGGLAVAGGVSGYIGGLPLWVLILNVLAIFVIGLYVAEWISEFRHKYRSQSAKYPGMTIDAEVREAINFDLELTITTVQHRKLVNRLLNLKGQTVHIFFILDDEHSQKCANDLFAAFHEAGWRVSSSNYISTDIVRHSPSIRVWACSTEEAIRYGSVFQDSGISVEAQAKFTIPKSRTIELLVGPKQEVNVLNKPGR